MPDTQTAFCFLCGVGFETGYLQRTRTDEDDLGGLDYDDFREGDWYYDGRVLTPPMIHWLDHGGLFMSKSDKAYMRFPSDTEALVGHSYVLSASREGEFEGDTYSPGVYNRVFGDAAPLPHDPYGEIPEPEPSYWSEGTSTDLWIRVDHHPYWPDPRRLPVHNACREILTRVLAYRGYAREDREAVDKVYKGLLREFEEGRKRWKERHHRETLGLYPEHKYYTDIDNFWGQYWESHLGFEYLCADPVDINDLDKWYTTLLDSRQTETTPLDAQAIASFTNTNSSDPFSRLPPELLYTIFAALPLCDITALRFASRRAAVTPLDAAFWKARVLSPKADMPWFWELNIDPLKSKLPESNNWKGLFKRLAFLPLEVALPGEPLGLRNRRRIWKIVQGFVEGSGL